MVNILLYGKVVKKIYKNATKKNYIKILVVNSETSIS